jgi:hypothetical protein
MKNFILIGFMLLMFSQLSYAQNVHVLVNIWDGTKWSKLESLYNKGRLPNLSSIGQLHHLTANKDCFGDKCMITVTMPQHATMFTGCLADVHGTFSNNDYQLIPDNITVQEMIKNNNPLVRVAQISGKKIWFGHKVFGNIMDEVDLYMQSNKNPPFHLPTVQILLDSWKNESYFIVLHFRMPDAQGHKTGVDSPEYISWIKKNDETLGLILNSMKKYENGAQTFVYVLSDHGFGCPTPKSHNCSHNTFIVSNNSALDHDIYMKDVASFLLSHFGLNSYCEGRY